MYALATSCSAIRNQHACPNVLRRRANTTRYRKRKASIMANSQPFHDSEPAVRPVIGVLLVHGLNGSRKDFAEMETLLLARGMVAVNMLLPGHGSKVKDMLSSGWEEWSQAVHSELRALKQRCDVVFLVGHSLGGALSLHVAAHEDRSEEHTSE